MPWVVSKYSYLRTLSYWLIRCEAQYAKDRSTAMHSSISKQYINSPESGPVMWLLSQQLRKKTKKNKKLVSAHSCSWHESSSGTRMRHCSGSERKYICNWQEPALLNSTDHTLARHYCTLATLQCMKCFATHISHCRTINLMSILHDAKSICHIPHVAWW